MKTLGYKFVAVAFVGLLAISGVKSEGIPFCKKDAMGEAIVQIDEEKVKELTEERLNKPQSTDEEASDFQFPNVFDVFRFIF